MELPKEADKEVCQQLEQLAEAGAVLQNGGHGDKVLGHLSFRDPRGRGFWMKRSGISLAELQGPQDFILLDFEGKKKKIGNKNVRNHDKIMQKHIEKSS